MAPMANAPYARPIWPPSNFSVLKRYVPMLTYHAPQMKYWRNMKTLSWSLRVDWVGVGFMGKGKRAGSEGR